MNGWCFFPVFVMPAYALQPTRFLRFKMESLRAIFNRTTRLVCQISPRLIDAPLAKVWRNPIPSA